MIIEAGGDDFGLHWAPGPAGTPSRPAYVYMTGRASAGATPDPAAYWALMFEVAWRCQSRLRISIRSVLLPTIDLPSVHITRYSLEGYASVGRETSRCAALPAMLIPSIR